MTLVNLYLMNNGILLKKTDILHKFYLLKLLTGIVDNPFLASSVYFKGGTCATMLGFLDRFSVDLDFDLKPDSKKEKVREILAKVFEDLGFKIIEENKKVLFFNLKYDAPLDQRSTLKVSIYDEIVRSNVYKPFMLPVIGRLVNCQTIETMFANKLVAPMDRYNRHEKIAGRDIYDIHYFFSKGYKFREEIVKERTGLNTDDYVRKLIKFIEEKVTEKILTEDLNALLPYDKFQKIRKTLKAETLLFLKSL